MKKAIIVLILIGVIGFAIYRTSENELKPQAKKPNLSQSFNDWIEFVPQSKAFTVSLPSKPRYAKDVVAIPHTDFKRSYQIFVSEKIDGTLFIVSVITYPPGYDISNKNRVLHSLIEDFLQSKGDNRLKDIHEGVSNDSETIEFSLYNNSLDVRGRAMVEGNTMYVTSYYVKKGDFDQEEFDHFVNSFTLLQKKHENPS